MSLVLFRKIQRGSFPICSFRRYKRERCTSHVSVSMLVPSDCGEKSCSFPHFSGEEGEIKEDAHQEVVIGGRFPAVPCTVQHLGQTLCVLSPVEVWPVFLTCFNALRAGMASCFSRVRMPYPPYSSQTLLARVCRSVPLSGLPSVSSWQTLCC